MSVEAARDVTHFKAVATNKLVGLSATLNSETKRIYPIKTQFSMDVQGKYGIIEFK